MSTGYNPKNDETDEQALKVQELVISNLDPAMYSSASGSTCILVNEPIDKVYLARSKDDSANLMVEYAAADISIVDSQSLTSAAPSDRGAIKISGLASLDANDVVIVRYTVLQHL